MKTALNSASSFSDVLNFNYKFRDINSKTGHKKEYDNIKIQTEKLNNMQNFDEFIRKIAGQNLLAPKINLDVERLITYSYVCLEQSSWNENTDLNLLQKEFQKYHHILPANEQIDDTISNHEIIYQEKYAYYGFSKNSMVLLTSASNIKNYTSLLFQYENEYLYHYIYNLHQKIYLKKLNYKFSKGKKFAKAQNEFLEFAKNNWIYEVTNDEKGNILDKYNRQAQNIDEMFLKLKSKYNLLYKEYKIERVNRRTKWIVAIMCAIIVLALLL